METQFITFDNMEADTLYVCVAYRYIYGSCNYFYLIQIKKLEEADIKIMMVTNGCLFDHLEIIRVNNSTIPFQFKKKIIATSNSVSAEYIIIGGVHTYMNLDNRIVNIE